MKALALAFVAPLLAGSLALAVDQENKETTDVSKNPITGTKTVTKKSKSKMKKADGHSHDVEVTEKTKMKKDGEVTKKVEVDASAEDSNKH